MIVWFSSTNESITGDLISWGGEGGRGGAYNRLLRPGSLR